MRIQSSQIIYGFPAVKIRDFLRGVSDLVSTESAAHILACSQETALRVLQSLQKDGYLEGPSPETGYWGITLNGAQLAAATAAKPISRKTAERLLKELLSRVEQINKSSEYLFRVSCVAVFGSYLKEVDVLSDLDIGYCLEPKAADSSEHQRLCKQQSNSEQDNGRRFGNMVEKIYWPNIKVIQALRGRARSVSMEPLDGLIQQMPPDFRYKIIHGELPSSVSSKTPRPASS